MIIYFVWWLPRARAAGKLRLHRLLNWLALVCAGFYILFMIIGGLLNGFGKSPYSFTPLWILNNIIFVGTSLAGMEISRAFLINRMSRHRAGLSIVLISLFFTALNLPLGKISVLHTSPDIVQYIGNDVLPAISENVLASYFALLGGPVPALLYRGVIQAFQWFSPFLPDLTWTTKAFIGILVPFVSLVLVQRLYLTEARKLKRNNAAEEKPAGWIVTAVASVLLVWFSVGLFPLYPSVILSGSMQPEIKKGDIVLMKKIAGDDAEPGDIVQYRFERLNITHRVIKVQNANGAKTFQTKGDANSGPDPKSVGTQQIKGKVVCVIPKIGWGTLTLREFIGGMTPKGVEF
jgi:signal peptidase